MDHLEMRYSGAIPFHWIHANSFGCSLDLSAATDDHRLQEEYYPFPSETIPWFRPGYRST